MAATTASVLDLSKELPFARDFINFMNASPSHFHAVEASAALLRAGGFTQIYERKDEDWKGLKPGGKYFFHRNQSSIVAFAVGAKYKAGNGFTVIGAHTDSPVLKVKPISKGASSGCLQLAVETYGGGLWNTWFDRDLSVAGRVIVGNKTATTFESKLVRIDRPILRIPNLAIHLNRDVNTAGFAPNTQTHLVPVYATASKAEAPTAAAESEAKESALKGFELSAEHHPLIIKCIADELKVDAGQIRDFELCLYDTQPATIGGLLNEFIIARGLDNLMMSYVSLRSLIDSTNNAADLAEEEHVRLVALFDNEEVGSASVMGAASVLMPSVLKRIHGSDDASYDSAIRKSFLISADMAHALHPNYSDKHEPLHRPLMHKGLVIKQNANLRYATNAVTMFFITEIARRHGIPLQKFVIRNDMPCGSTIGSILASGVGIRTVDVGIAQWAMHSIRETCGTADAYSAYELFKRVFAEFPAVDKSLVGADM